MAAAKKPSAKGAAACKRAAKLLNEKVLDVLESLLEAEDDKVRLAAAKEIKEIVRQTDPGETDAASGREGPARVFVVTGIDRKPGG